MSVQHGQVGKFKVCWICLTVQCWSMVRLAGCRFAIKTCSWCRLVWLGSLWPVSWGGLTSALGCFQPQGLQCGRFATLQPCQVTALFGDKLEVAVSVQHGQVGKFKVLVLQPCQVCSLACLGNELGSLQRCLQGCNCSLADLVVVVVVVGGCCLYCHICGTCRTQLLPVDCCGLCCVGHLQCWSSGKEELQFCSSA